MTNLKVNSLRHKVESGVTVNSSLRSRVVYGIYRKGARPKGSTDLRSLARLQ